MNYVPVSMNLKFLLLSFSILLTSTSKEQSLKIDTFKTALIDTSSVIRWQCQARPSIILKKSYPLIIINGKKFKNCLLQNIYFDFDTSNILTLQVLNPQNDSVKFYGKAGTNGVIIIKTKKPIQWVSIKQILTQKSNDILSTHRKTLIKVDNSFFDMSEELFFQKDLIDNISVVNNTIEYYIDRQFNSILKITITKKSDTLH